MYVRIFLLLNHFIIHFSLKIFHVWCRILKQKLNDDSRRGNIGLQPAVFSFDFNLIIQVPTLETGYLIWTLLKTVQYLSIFPRHLGPTYDPTSISKNILRIRVAFPHQLWHMKFLFWSFAFKWTFDMWNYSLYFSNM